MPGVRRATMRGTRGRNNSTSSRSWNMIEGKRKDEDGRDSRRMMNNEE